MFLNVFICLNMNMKQKPRFAIIYEICHTPTGKRYVGSTLGGFSRWTQHVWQLQRGVHGNHQLQRDWTTSSVDEWTFRLLELDVPEDAKLGREAHWIQVLNPAYNVKVVNPSASRHERIEKALELRQRGATIRQIAQLTRMSVGTIHGYLKRYEH